MTDLVDNPPYKRSRRTYHKANSDTGPQADPDVDNKVNARGIYAILNDFKEFTTAHGIPHVAHAKGAIRTTFWVLITLAAVGGFCYNAYKNFETFLDYPVSVSVNINTERFLRFPAVTVCNHNAILLSKLEASSSLKALSDAFGNSRKKRSLSGDAQHASRKKRSNTPTFGGRSKDGRAMDGRFEFQKQLTETISDMAVEERIAMGHSLNNLILSCKYNGYDCNISKDFYPFYDASYGNCYVFNWGRNGSSTFDSYRPGATHGLSIIFNAEQSQYVGYLTEAAGLRVVVHPQDNMPFPADDGISAAPGQLTYVGVKKLHLTRMSAPWGICSHSGRDINRNVYAEIHGVGYTTKACYQTCYQGHLISDCQCADSDYPMFGTAFGFANVSTCKITDSTQEDCVSTTFDKYNNNELGCDCPEPCNETAFITGTSNVMWPSDAYKEDLFKLIRQHPTPAIGDILLSNDTDEYKRNFGKVIVFFEEFNYESISESEGYSLYGLISDFGGILGLFIGFSMMTIIEFFELGFDILITAILLCANKDKTTNLRGCTLMPIEPIKMAS